MLRLETAKDSRDLKRLIRTRMGKRLVGLLLGLGEDEVADQARMEASTQHLVRWRKWMTHGEALRGVVIGLLLAEGYASSPYRRRDRFTEIVNRGLVRSVSDLATDGVLLVANGLAPVGGSNRRFNYTVTRGGRPIVAVTATYEAFGGGRQRTDLLLLPQTAAGLAANGVELVVIADGPGYRSLRKTVAVVVDQLSNFMNLRGLERGDMQAALQEAVTRPRIPTTLDEEEARKVATTSLRQGRPVTAALLNLQPSFLRDFATRYQASHPEYDLSRRSDGVLQPKSTDILTTLHDVVASAERSDIGIARLVNAFGARLGTSVTSFGSNEDAHVFGLGTEGLRLRLPNPLPVVVIKPRPIEPTLDPSSVENLLESVGLVARMAIAIDLSDSNSSGRWLSAVETSTEFAVVSDVDLSELLLRNEVEAIRYLVQILLRRIDLGLISPFVSEGPTPPDMFFGRESEMRRIGERITSTSFALVGGRKVGKTSILQRLEDRLGKRLPTSYIDCQALHDRDTFLAHLEARVGEGRVLHPSQADPQLRLNAFASQVFGDRQGVLLLDEVDALFSSDADDKDRPHLLSQSLRALVQSRVFSLVVTGERALYRLTSDPHSPHWNFCIPMRIGPLTRQAASQLIRDPLEVLSISLSEDAIDAALDGTACHPNLLQYLGNRLIESTALRTPSGGLGAIQLSDVQGLTHSPQFESRFVSVFWSQATPFERLVSVLLGREEGSPLQELLLQVRRLIPKAEVSELQRALGFLELYSIASASPQGWMYTSSVLADHFRPLAETPFVDEWARASA
jgi:hypothetical protein